MRIHILGGGPAGLYFAILMKKTDPSHEIRVWERNAPEYTFGWGVVFSDETLGNLAAADREVYRSITDAFAYWDSIDIHFEGERIRSRGHGFCGMSRKRLLMILQERARALGVECLFETEVKDVASLRDCDLLVGADGINSRVRAHFEDRFEPSIDVRKSPYIWFGTPQSFEAFTFSFRENEHGVFQIHAYQFEEETSTVIVETDEESWRNAGLHEASTEASIRYCEALFAEELGGHPLLENKSSWIRFPTVKLPRWHVENVVLIGDAAHTAHFSVGSGTKLAMEDSIALAEALNAGHPDLSTALDAYEEAREVDVGKTQKSAQQSLEWFENVKRYLHFDPMPFAFSLLTRSRRITHENLRMRDPEFVDRADRWYLEHVGQPAPPPGEKPCTPMFTPFRLRGMELVNRVVVSPMCQYSAVGGVPNDWHLVHLGSRAIGGAGLVFTEMTDIAPEARISPGCAGIWNEAQRDAWKRIVDFVHANSRAKIALQIAHAGRKGSTKRMWEGIDDPLDEGNWEILGPSPIPYKDGSQTPRPMTRQDMDEVRERFVASVALAVDAGFDMLELHLAHGYLLSSFLTPISNQRDDAYGGSLENRMRYPLEVVEAVRAAWPDDKPMSVRISATDWVPGGFTAEDSVVLARELKARGVDIIDVSTGQTSPDAAPIYGRAYQAPFADKIRNEVGIPTLTVGNITTADQINTILLAGRADLCAMARPHLKDPYFTLHAAEELEHWDVHYPDQYLSAKPAPRE
ncbi:MAG TPA: bifunctional salicylyl-CoA 5-hydroxylase/oxidoreductase [Sandaracinaceae bacterium LLY-WYZ-13_1]|nr:bifunctional salicylyl-CoA 5-hydroxylase/oxidoreductase [Sandaracinaceae bacterium LLY-WYZ-13_1]